MPEEKKSFPNHQFETFYNDFIHPMIVRHPMDTEFQDAMISKFDELGKYVEVLCKRIDTLGDLPQTLVNTLTMVREMEIRLRAAENTIESLSIAIQELSSLYKELKDSSLKKK